MDLPKTCSAIAFLMLVSMQILTASNIDTEIMQLEQKIQKSIKPQLKTLEKALKITKENDIEKYKEILSTKEALEEKLEKTIIEMKELEEEKIEEEERSIVLKEIKLIDEKIRGVKTDLSEKLKKADPFDIDGEDGTNDVRNKLLKLIKEREDLMMDIR